MKKIILTGASGQLGKALKKELSKDFEVSAFSKNELDITDFAAVQKICEKLKPDFLVNAAAYTNVDLAESERELALKINSESVGNLAEICKKNGAKLIHFSTDYVFDGENENGFLENDTTRPINFYGESKLAGEQKIQESSCDFAIVRTSWLFGEGENFVTKMLELAQKNNEIKVVSDQIGSPTFTTDLAKATREILECHSHTSSCHSRGSGNPEKIEGEIFHVTNSGTANWADFARKIFEIKKLPIKVINIATTDFPTPARRPQVSILRNSKLPEMRNWKIALKEFLLK